MKIINKFDCKTISGGSDYTCQEALIREAIEWDIEDITQFCTKEQFTVYSLAMVDQIYNHVPYSEEAEVAMIKSLAI